MKERFGIAVALSLVASVAHAQEKSATAPKTSTASPAQSAASQTPAAAPQPQDQPAIIEVPEPKTPDEVPSQQLDWTVIGNLQIDALAHANVDSDDRRSILVRRARLSAVVDWNFDWRFAVSGELGKYAGLRDASIQYRGWPVYIEAGRIVEPFGLLQASSSAAAFMERPESAGLAPGYGLGIAGNYGGDRWGATAGVFSATKNDLDEGNREEFAITGRLTGAPVLTDDWTVHLGASASYRDSREGFLQFVSIPETTLLLNLNAESALFFQTNEEGGSNKYFLWGMELAARYKSALLMTEYLSAQLKDAFLADPFNENFLAVESPSFNGFYIEGSWAITGEERDYSVRRGTFSGLNRVRYPALKHDFGAIEIAARYSHIDLSDPLARGDTASVTSIGVNWLPIEYVKVMLEGLHITRDTGAEQNSVNAVQLRVQLYYAVP